MRRERTTKEKMEIFRSHFSGLPHVYGTYDPFSGRARIVKAPVTDLVIYNHLKGVEPYGVFLLSQDRTRAVAADFDNHNALPPKDFIATAAHYCLPAYIERSKSKGFHSWIFLNEAGVSAAKVRSVVRHILKEIDALETEFFPKHDQLNNKVPFGNFIHAPLFGALVPEGKTVFISPETLEPYPDQWEFLESTKRVSESQLDEIIELNSIPITTSTPKASEKRINTEHAPSFGLPPCAQRILQQGISSHQRVTCFRLAIQLKKIGLPYDIAVAALAAWSEKNRPTNGKRPLTEGEIRVQTACAYNKDYRGCGCEDTTMQLFCDPNCPIRRKTNGHLENKQSK